MESHDILSLTKCCFVHKPAKKKKSSIIATAYHEVQFPLWNEMAAKIKIIEKKAYAETFDNILTFVQNCVEFPLQETKEIPAAVLVMGVNMSDHSHIFHFLETYLHLHDVYTTVILDSKKSSSFSSVLQNLYFEILNKFEQFFNFETSLPKKQDCSFEKFYECYQDLLEKVSSSKKRTPKKKQSNIDASKMPIVLLIQDVENFNSELLQKLVLICKFYSDKIPIVLVFGMSSAMVSLHNILPQDAYSCLDVETFQSVSATEFLTRVIDEIVISPNQPFKLGPKVFRLIIDTVLYHDFSISNLSYLLKFSVIEHLHENNLASLCCQEFDIAEKVNNLSNEEIQSIKLLPSLKIFLDNNPNFQSLINKPSSFREFIITQIQNLFHDQKVIIVLLKLLHCFVKDLPECPLGKQLREIYSLSLEKEVCLSSQYAIAEKLLKMQSQNSLLQKLKAGLEVLNTTEKEFSSNVIKNAKCSMENCIEKLSNLSNEADKKIPEPTLFLTEKIMSRFQLQERIQESIKQKRSNYEVLRKEIVEDLLSIFKYIRPPSAFPLNEIFYFDNLSSVKQHLMAVPRVTSCHALANPQLYFKCNCCKISHPEEIQVSMPDICLLYKLHLESGKLINLRDWLEGFKATKCKDGFLSPKVKTKNKENDGDLNIRFLQAVSELQLLGFIKSTNRKTDHVARLTFGIL